MEKEYDSVFLHQIYEFSTGTHPRKSPRNLAECLETGVYEREERYQIWRKYNISIVEKALSKLQNNLSLKSLVEISGDLMMFKDSRAVEPLIQALEIPLSLADPYESIGIQ